MAILSKERPIWFTPRRAPFGGAQIIEIRPRTVGQRTLPGWVGDESSGFSAEELEKKIKERQVRTFTNHKTEIVDVSKLSDNEFTFRLEQIRTRQPKKR